MAKEKRKKRKDQDESNSQAAESNSQINKDQGKQQDSDDSGSKKEPALDLDRLKHTSATQAPRSTPAKASPIAGTVRNRGGGSAMPEMDWKFSIIAGVSAAFIGMLAHIFSINGGLVLYDRFNLAYLLNKMLMERVSKTILIDMLGAGPLTQPWLKSSFISDFGDYGLNFAWYHAVNVLWHAANSGLLFFFVLTVARHLHHQKRLKLNPYYLALVTAVLFACHPLSCESVSYLSARSCLLGANNFFLALNIFLWAALVRHKVARLCFTALGLLVTAMSVWSNPECMPLPAVALFTILLIKHPLSDWQKSMAEHPFISGILLALSILFPFMTMLGVEHTTALSYFSAVPQPLVYYASQVKALPFYYLRCFLLPIGLSIDPPLVIAQSLTDPFFIAAVLMLAAIAYLLAIRLRQAMAGLACLFLLAGFLPHALMIQKEIVADWVAYLPLAGAMIFAAYPLLILAEKNLPRAATVFISITILFLGLSIYRDWQWSSNTMLWQSALHLRPKSALANAMLSIEYLKMHEFTKAEELVNKAVGYGPELLQARLAQGKLLLAQNKPDQASAIFAGALNLAERQKLPEAALSECRLGELECLIKKQNEKQGNALLSKLFQELSGDARLIYLVALASYEGKNYEKAFKLFDQAVTSDPSLQESYEMMAQCALELRAYEYALQAAQKYMQAYDCEHARLLYARAAIAGKRYSEAEEILKQILAKEPKNPRVLYLLSRMYKMSGNLEDWKKYKDDAIKIDPDTVVKFALPELDYEESLRPLEKQGDSGGK